MADADLVQMPERGPQPLPSPIKIDPNQPLRFTPKELRILKAQTGRVFAELMAAEAPVVLTWFRLRREGWPDLRYADLEECEIEIGEPEALDPLSGTQPTGSPPSADSGT
jgi:hypothetical protein